VGEARRQPAALGSGPAEDGEGFCGHGPRTVPRLLDHTRMRAVVIYESLTGNTKEAGHRIAAALTAKGVETVACPTTRVDYQALSVADLVVVGTWTDGFLIIGQRPGRAPRLRALPALGGKKALVYCTYAIDPGKVLEKMTAIVEERGATVLGGMAIRRSDIPGGVAEFVDRVLANVPG
jgi:hypothetical protein